MAQVSRGVRKVLEVPWVYSLFQKSLQKKSLWSEIIEEQLAYEARTVTVLDIGCGPGTFLARMGDRVDPANFVGIDPSQDYCERASELFPNAKFYCGTVSTVALEQHDFDLIVISGVLHHVDDDEAKQIMRFAHNHNSDGGLIISVDPVLFPGQNIVARFLAKADRGQNVRTVKSLEQLWIQALPGSNVQTSIKSGYLRVPYNHVVCVVSS